MQIGCGKTIKTINGIRYLYFWWYERQDGRSVQRFRCMGRDDSLISNERADFMMRDFYLKSRKTLTELIQKM